MQELETAQNHLAASVKPSITCDHPNDVAAIHVLPDFCLRVRFHDGVEGIVDLSRRVRSPNAGVFAVLADPACFARAGIEFGAVWWPGDIDLAPDAMHAELKAHGRWAL